MVLGFLSAIPWLRSSRASATIKLQESEITARDSAIDRFHSELVELEERCREREADLERRHTTEIGKLTGRLDAMTPVFAAQVAKLLYEEGVRAGSVPT